MKRKSFINEITHIRPGQVEIYGFSSLSQSIAAAAQIALLNSFPTGTGNYIIQGLLQGTMTYTSLPYTARRI